MSYVWQSFSYIWQSFQNNPGQSLLLCFAGLLCGFAWSVWFMMAYFAFLLVLEYLFWSIEKYSFYKLGCIALGYVITSGLLRLLVPGFTPVL